MILISQVAIVLATILYRPHLPPKHQHRTMHTRILLQLPHQLQQPLPTRIRPLQRRLLLRQVRSKSRLLPLPLPLALPLLLPLPLPLSLPLPLPLSLSLILYGVYAL